MIHKNLGRAGLRRSERISCANSRLRKPIICLEGAQYF